ncbi:MAG: leucine-rich repeat protein, partial [Ruminococcus sp.]|nr:leucine-rich repeat protein [Ruminococcus sp.]
MNRFKMVTKRTISVVLCTIMLLSVFVAVPFSVSAQTTDVVTTGGFISSDIYNYPIAIVNGVKYTLIESACYVTGRDETLPEDVVIEKEVEGLPVKFIWSGAFDGSSRMVSVTIPNSVIDIEPNAFSNCKNLKTVVFEEGSQLRTMFEGAFENCTSLESVSLPENLISVTEYVFKGCTNLKSVTLAKNAAMRYIGVQAFSGCESLESIDIPDTVETIADKAFENCYSLSKVELREGLQKIGEKAFFNCYNLYDIYVPQSVMEIGAYAFACFEYEDEVYIYSDFTVLGSPDSLADEYAEMYMVKYENAIPAPKLTAISNTDSGIKLSFEKLSGVGGYYRVYRKTAGTSWTKLADVTTSSYTDTTATAGTKYTYTVKFIGNDGTTSLYDKNGLSITRLKTPSVSKIENTASGAKITFSAVAGAGKYRVYYKTSDGWKSIGDTQETSFVHTDAVSGTTYTYTVKAFDSDGMGSAHNSTGWSNKYIATPYV